MIKAYSGYFGEGKTLSMVAEGIEFLKKGYTVYSNIPFGSKKFIRYPLKLAWERKSWGYEKPIVPIYLEPEQFNYALANARDAIFLLDEASIWFSNYNWNVIDPKILYRLHQVRKLNIHIIYTCQSFKHVMKRLRDFTQIVVECHAMFKKKNGAPRLIRHVYYNPEYYTYSVYSFEVEKKYIVKREFIWGKKLSETMKDYDTTDLIKFSMGSGKSKYDDPNKFGFSENNIVKSKENLNWV